MDDHVYAFVLEYAECDLVPRFQEEYRRCHEVTECGSYEEMLDLCTALNAIGKWAGMEKKTPKSFIEAE
jgi:hypothetical protein